MWRALYLVEIFQSTLSVRRATTRSGLIVSGDVISIHALRKESDRTITPIKPLARLFQSTLSVRRATWRRGVLEAQRNISIHALRKESDNAPKSENQSVYISIHALRKESDRAAGHFCPLSETQASCLALSISNNTTGTTNNMPKTSSCLSVSF